MFLFMRFTTNISLPNASTLDGNPNQYGNVFATRNSRTRFGDHRFNTNPSTRNMANANVREAMPRLIPKGTKVIKPVRTNDTTDHARSDFNPSFVNYPHTSVRTRDTNGNIVTSSMINSIRIISSLSVVRFLSNINRSNLSILTISLSITHPTNSMFTLFILRSSRPRIFRLLHSFIRTFKRNRRRIFPSSTNYIFLNMISMRLQHVTLNSVNVRNISTNYRATTTTSVNLFNSSRQNIERTTRNRDNVATNHPTTSSRSVHVSRLLANGLRDQVRSFVGCEGHQPGS